MPGLSIESPDRHSHETAGGATAAPRGMQPILVQTECALTAFIAPAHDSGSSGIWLERMFPRSLRAPRAAAPVPRETDAGPVVEYSSFACPACAGPASPNLGRLSRISRRR